MPWLDAALTQCIKCGKETHAKNKICAICTIDKEISRLTIIQIKLQLDRLFGIFEDDNDYTKRR